MGWDNVISENLRRGRRNIRYLLSSLPTAPHLPSPKQFSSPAFRNSDFWSEMGYFSFSLPLERGMEEVFLTGGKGLVKRLFLECHAQGGLILLKVGEFGFSLYFSTFFQGTHTTLVIG